MNTDNNLIPTDITDENKSIILGSCYERKKIGFELFKEWENNQKDNINLLRSITHNIKKKTEDLLSKSQLKFKTITQFLINFSINITKAEDLSNYLKLYSDNNITKDEVYNNINKFNNNFSEFNNKIESFYKIKKELIENKIKKEIKPFETNIKMLYNKIEIIDKKIMASSKQLIDDLSLFTNFYKEISPNNKNKKDILYYSVKFYLSLKALIFTLINYGNIILEIWNSALTLEEKKNTYLQSIFNELFILFGKYISPELHSIFIDFNNEFKNLNIKEVAANYYSIDTILLKEEIDIIRLKIKLEQEKLLKLENIQTFFCNFGSTIKEVKFKYFYVHFWKCFVNKQDVYLYLSIDFNFLSIIISLQSRK